ncbi:putative quinol monooxygenase [Streptomyces cacaoi]|uniref:putative quinol monooxygenase n=1 Tax=Streptomyces cacaoi TaxID=1898 RepID=UPI0026321EC7|nr:antibiotic biosynthesis monooxygenase [Streptomyces cacaoi]
MTDNPAFDKSRPFPVAAFVTVKEGEEQAFLSLLQEIAAYLAEAAPDKTYVYSWARDTENPRLFTLYEVHANWEAAMWHRQDAALVDFGKRFAPLVESTRQSTGTWVAGSESSRY